MAEWTDPVKNRPAKAETLATKGDFGQFKELMRKIVKKQEEKTKQASASHAPDAS